jgi:hypothetical protein
MIATSIYLACACLSIVCCALVWRRHMRRPSHLLRWSGFAFASLAANNLFLVLDMVILPSTNFGGPIIRNAFSAGAGGMLLYALLAETA